MHVHADARRSEPRADWRIRASAAAGVAAAAGVLAGWLMPRGAVTSWQAITAMATAVIVGAAAGWFLRSRWAVLLAPATFMMVFELARIRVDGPTVDAIRIDSLYGLMALIAGRGIDGIIMVLPMIVGVSYGVSLAARSGLPAVTPRRRQLIRRTLLVLMSLALIALAAGFARPASTDAIVGADGKPVPGSIAELTEVEIGGWVTSTSASTCHTSTCRSTSSRASTKRPAGKRRRASGSPPCRRRSSGTSCSPTRGTPRSMTSRGGSPSSWARFCGPPDGIDRNHNWRRVMDLLTRADVDLLARRDEPGTRVSLFLPTHRLASEDRTDPLRWKNLLTSTESALAGQGMSRADIGQLLAPAWELQGTAQRGST